MRQDSSNYNAAHLICILIVCLFAFFVNNQVIPADIMESRNLATAQEMVSQGNYLTPTMNGELRLEKPPLPTWIAAGVELITPGNLILQRYIAGIIASLMVLFLYLFTSRLTGNRTISLMGSLILATCFNIILMGRTATWDIFCHSFMLGAIYFLFVALEKQGAQWKNLLLAGVFMGLSFLSKGPVSFYALLLPFLISYLLVYKPSIKNKKYSLTAMIGLCAIISFWWMAYILFFHPDMAFSVAQKEASSWLDRNVRPIYYYWQFPAEAGIWALFFVTAIVHYFVYKKDAFRKENRFAIIWLFASLILLSIIPEKKTRYLLPILIPGALVIAFYFYHSIKDMTCRGEKVLFKINAIIIAIILIVIPITLYIMFYDEGLISPFILVLIAVISWTLSVYLFRSVLNQKGIRVVRVFSSVILAMFLVTGLCLIPIGRMFINDDIHSIRLLRDNEKVEGLPFFYDAKEDIRMELVYEANKIIRPLDITDTMAIRRHAPFVFVSSHSLDSLFRDKNVVVEIVDTFDNNWRKVTDKRYNKALVKEVGIIRSKR